MPAPLSILVISDDPHLVLTLKEVAQQSSTELVFRTASTAQDGIRNLNDLPKTSLIILESSVCNNSTELEFLASLRANPQWLDRPILVLVDAQLPCDLVAAYEANATSVSFRPYSPSDWSAYWRIVLQRYSADL